MNKKRILRDVGMLLAICGVYYGSTLVMAHVKEKEDPTAVNFSTLRIQADEHVDVRDWDGAISEYTALVERDPFNGYAWYRLGQVYRNVRTESKQEVQAAQLLENNSGNRVNELQQRFLEYDEIAEATFKKSCEFLRYRGKSNYFLATIYADRGDLDQAIACLEIYADIGDWGGSGMANAMVFGVGGPRKSGTDAMVSKETRLHQSTRFWELVDRESRARMRSHPFGYHGGYTYPEHVPAQQQNLQRLR